MTTAYIGIDLHRTVIQICVLDAQGERVAEERIRYEGLEEGLAAVAFVRSFAPDARVAVEAAGLNRWFVNACLEAGLDVLVCDPRKLDLKKLGRKTDRRDAREIARRLWLGDLDRMARTYYPSDSEYGRRKLLRVRHRLVQMRQQTINQLRGMLNAYQLSAPRGVLYTRPSRERLASVQLPVPELQQAFEDPGTKEFGCSALQPNSGNSSGSTSDLGALGRWATWIAATRSGPSCARS